jgi:hypothetical protein
MKKIAFLLAVFCVSSLYAQKDYTTKIPKNFNVKMYDNSINVDSLALVLDGLLKQQFKGEAMNWNAATKEYIEYRGKKRIYFDKMTSVNVEDRWRWRIPIRAKKTGGKALLVYIDKEMTEETYSIIMFLVMYNKRNN